MHDGPSLADRRGDVGRPEGFDHRIFGDASLVVEEEGCMKGAHIGRDTGQEEERPKPSSRG